jgi:UDP-N-acetylmuramoyl-L-alanyl-D-glutamate--2,6-diaminopimelate ligase
MGALADEYSKLVIVTDEDPYDENPLHIMQEVAVGITKHAPVIIEKRREAIAYAISQANPGDVVLITGKGTDPYIMRANGEKEVWDDASVAREELLKQLANSK